MTTTPPADPPPPRLDLLLGELRAVEPPPADPSFTDAVVRTARWQRVVRHIAETVGRFGGAFGDALTTMTKPTRRP
jgi:hypothetical protein